MDWQLIRNITTSVGAVVAVLVAIRLVPALRHWWDRRTLLNLGPDAYRRDDADPYLRYYVRPDCQSVDPSGQEDFRCIGVARDPLFARMDRVLGSSPGPDRFQIILADSGMGKTAFHLNYFARHRRRWRRRDIG